LSIRGRTTDNAVLCTNSKTYNIRAVSVSNTFFVGTSPTYQEEIHSSAVTGDKLVIRDSINQIFELVPCVPKIERFDAMFRGQEYGEQDEDGSDEEEVNSVDPLSERPVSTTKVTYDDLLADVQASDTELRNALKQSHILSINSHLRPIAPAYLTHILVLVLNTLSTISSQQTQGKVKIPDITEPLEFQHHIPREVTTQVLEWFGITTNGEWEMDKLEVVKAVGYGTLMKYKERPVDQIQFIDEWAEAVGDAYAEHVGLKILEGNYLSNSTANGVQLKFFPSSELPADPATRFADLFLTRPRWSAEDIVPFLKSIAVDAKERDKLLLKFARPVTENGTVWYTARTTHL
ncbi:hypothetical protein SISSUDRAFT_982864, partial [Sistotremastrum suecicum HHB10207 ss-3]